MKKLLVASALLISTAVPASAETVRTCSSVYGGGEVCGETTTTTTVKHDIVETKTSVAGNELATLIFSLAGAALVATGLYKLTYRSYILG